MLANSPIGNPGKFFRDVVTNLYLNNIAPEFTVGGWIARHNLTSQQYQEAFNDYVGNHGMQLMDVSGYGSATPLYAALWVKTASPPAWQARHGLTAADYQNTFNQLTAQGYHPVLVNGYATAAGPRFACIFQQGATGAWVARHGLTAAQYQTAFNDYLAQGYTLDWVSGYFDGNQDLYAAIWRKEPAPPAWQARHGLTSAQYQAFFDQMVGQGFKPVVVCGYSDGSQALYAAIFRQDRRRSGLAGAAWSDTGAVSDDFQPSGRTRLSAGAGQRLQRRCDDRIAAIWTK